MVYPGNYIGAGGYDSLLIFALIAVTVIGMIAQFKVQSVYKKYLKHRAQAGLPSYMVADQLLRRGGSNALLKPVAGMLTDHYDPRSNVVGLSESVYNSDSVAALAVAAHEIGHVMQYSEGYGPIKLRNAILPVASFSSSLAPIIVIAGLFMGITKLAQIGVILFAAVFAFQLITLPVEFNASRRALEMLSDGGYISYDEHTGVKRVLRAAAMTYVVAALASLITIVRLVLLTSGRNRR